MSDERVNILAYCWNEVFITISHERCQDCQIYSRLPSRCWVFQTFTLEMKWLTLFVSTVLILWPCAFMSSKYLMTSACHCGEPFGYLLILKSLYELYILPALAVADWFFLNPDPRSLDLLFGIRLDELPVECKYAHLQTYFNGTLNFHSLYV